MTITIVNFEITGDPTKVQLNHHQYDKMTCSQVKFIQTLRQKGSPELRNTSPPEWLRNKR